jgi:hypothetical protein
VVCKNPALLNLAETVVVCASVFETVAKLCHLCLILFKCRLVAKKRKMWRLDKRLDGEYFVNRPTLRTSALRIAPPFCSFPQLT